MIANLFYLHTSREKKKKKKQGRRDLLLSGSQRDEIECDEWEILAAGWGGCDS